MNSLKTFVHFQKLIKQINKFNGLLFYCFKLTITSYNDLLLIYRAVNCIKINQIVNTSTIYLLDKFSKYIKF
jgi:hypothetical protein